MVFLFGALSFALTQGFRGGSATITKDMAKISASEILDYAQKLSNVVTALRINGCADTHISFYSTQWETPANYDNINTPVADGDFSCHVFHSSGGAMIFENPPANTSADTQYFITGANLIADVGTSAPDLVLFAQDLKPEVCAAIDELLDIQMYAKDGYYNSLPFIGSYVNNGQIGDDMDNPEYVRGKRAACMKSIAYSGVLDDEHFFYYVLRSR